jgi:hypothetical protein
MKKVRVLAGLAGFAPVAIGMATPAAAQSGTSAVHRAENGGTPGQGHFAASDHRCGGWAADLPRYYLRISIL